MGQVIDLVAAMTKAKGAAPRKELPPHKSTLGLASRLERAMVAFENDDGSRGINARALAAKATIDQGYISRILNGETKMPSTSHIAYLAEALRVPFGWLAFGENDVVPKIAKTSE